VRGTVVIYDGTTPPEPPTPTHSNNSKKWLMSQSKKLIIRR
jgi:hypothetical protein